MLKLQHFYLVHVFIVNTTTGNRVINKVRIFFLEFDHRSLRVCLFVMSSNYLYTSLRIASKLLCIFIWLNKKVIYITDVLSTGSTTLVWMSWPRFCVCGCLEHCTCSIISAFKRSTPALLCSSVSTTLDTLDIQLRVILKHYAIWM